MSLDMKGKVPWLYHALRLNLRSWDWGPLWALFYLVLASMVGCFGTLTVLIFVLAGLSAGHVTVESRMLVGPGLVGFVWPHGEPRGI